MPFGAGSRERGVRLLPFLFVWTCAKCARLPWKARKEERGGMEEKATQVSEANLTPGQTFSMEEALQETEARLEKRVRPGQILTGKVVLVGSEGVAVDIGAKTEGIIPFNELTEKSLPEEELKALLKPGDLVRVQVIKVDPETGQVLLSRKRVEATEHWDRIRELYEKGEPVTVTVKEKVKGGVVADLDGVSAFIPASQLDLKRIPNLDAYVGQQILVKIIEFNRKKGRVLLSRRAVLEEEQKRVRTKSGEVVELRLSKSMEISPVEGGYYVRKEIVAPKSLDRAVLEIWFDTRYRPVRKRIEGGELIPIREWKG